jgi:hypothetical protein
MRKLNIILVFMVFLFVADGCHTHMHFSPAFSPETNVNPKPKTDSIKPQKDTVIEMKKQSKKKK